MSLYNMENTVINDLAPGRPAGGKTNSFFK